MKRTIIFLLLLFFLFQCLNAQKILFMRLYNAEGKKISKGHLFDTTDTSIILSKGTSGKKYIETPITQVDLIKTNRTVTKRIINTTLTVISVAGIIAAVIYIIARSRNEENRNWLSVNRGDRSKAKNINQNEISKSLKPFKRYEVNNNLKTWQVQRVLLNRLL